MSYHPLFLIQELGGGRGEQARALRVERLSSGYWYLRGLGPCNFAQPPHLPCDEETLRAHTFGEACEEFIEAVIVFSGGWR